jgi:hypothetical protein
MLKTVFHWRVQSVFIFLLLMSCGLLSAQSDSDLSEVDEYKIKSTILQDLQVSHALLLAINAEKKILSKGSHLSRYDFIISGFGDFFPLMKIQRSTIQIPNKKGWKLYIVSFPIDSAVNANILKRLEHVHALYPVFQDNAALIALDEDEEIIFLNRWGKKYRIEAYFEFSPNSPQSYIPYLKIRLYRRNVDTMYFRAHKRDTLLFESVSNYPSGVTAKLLIKVPENQPQNYSFEVLSETFDSSNAVKRIINSEKYPPAPFKNYEEKKQYLQAHLMSNIYLYKLKQKMDTIPKGQDFYQLRDSLLPAYDEYLDRCLPLHYGCCWVDYEKVEALKSHLPVDTRFLTERRGRFQVVVGEGRPFNKHVEFYKFYVDTTLVLCKRPDPQFEGAPGYEVTGEWRNEVGGGDWSYGVGGEWRYDLFYQPERKRAFIPEIGEFFPPPPLYIREPEPWRLSGCTMGTSYDTISGHYDLPYSGIGVPVNHYLLALDTETRDVFFVSGKDIFLSEVGPLYTDMKVGRDGERILNFDDTYYSLLKDYSYYRYTYIQDRLYRYLVERLDRSNVIYEDEEKVVLRCKGEEYKKEIELEVTLYFDDPENLEVRIL